MRLLLPLLLIAVGLSGRGSANRLSEMMYTTLDAQDMCFRLLDRDGEIGCTSRESGAVGILFRITSAQDLTNFASVSEDEYIALVSATMFADPNTLNTLITTDYCKGILVFDDVTDLSWSPDEKQPNSRYGLPFSNSTLFWNAVGGGFNARASNLTGGALFLNIPKPIFHLDADDLATVLQCYNTRNLGANPTGYPLCGAELSSWMWGAKDAETCLRRGYCDPLGSSSPMGTLRPLQANEEVVMVTAQLDTAAFFRDLAFGANADASGMVAALAVADILGRAANTAVRSLPRNVMFMLFHGETMGYIGSSRVGFDMLRNNFPSSTTPVTMERVSHYLELNQLMAGNSDTFNIFAFNSTATKVTEIFDTLTAAATAAEPSIAFTKQTTELPPASLRSLLYEWKNSTGSSQFGGIVATDHGSTFTNTRYHSHFDSGNNIGANDSTSAQVQRLCKLSTVLARTVWSLAAGVAPASITIPDAAANCSYVAALLSCITVNKDCGLVNQYVGDIGSGPMKRYISIQRDRNTVFLLSALAKALAFNTLPLTNDVCKSSNDPPNVQRFALNDGTCLNTTTYAYPARSPAFSGTTILKDADPRHSTWTEARWDNSIKVRIFLMSSPSQQIGILVGGIFALLGSFAFIYLAQKFTQHKMLELVSE